MERSGEEGRSLQFLGTLLAGFLLTLFDPVRDTGLCLSLLVFFRGDLCTFFIFCFAEEDVENFDVTNLSQDILRSIEADSFWCMSKLLDGIQVRWLCLAGYLGLLAGLGAPYCSSASVRILPLMIVPPPPPISLCHVD